MKAITLILSFIILILSKTMAQYPCFNGISSNPLNPINNQLPAKRNTFFNWQDSLWAMQPLLNCFRTTWNESPFYKIDNLEELREARDMKWADGWELIRRFVGLTENNSYTASSPEHLYVILYNKYTGILRVILLACRGADYNAAKIELKFDATSIMRTELFEMSRNQVSAMDKQYSISEFAAGVKYFNENSKYFYADFPMMYDPCTCAYKSKLNIVSRLISTGTINIEGGITGDIHTSSPGGKAQVQKPGTFSWKDLAGTVNGKLTTVHGSIDKFRSASQELASNIGRTDTANKKEAIDRLANFLKNNAFLQSGLNAIPWLKSAISLFDVFSGGGKSSPGPQEVKLLPLSVNLTAKLSGSISFINPYHNIIFSNPGSKDAHLDPDIYPYYNEILGIFNLLTTPTLYVQSNYKLLEDPESGNTVRITENRYKFDLNTFKYVLNPAAGLTIQNMKAAILIEGRNRNYSVCMNTARVIPPDFEFEGKDGITNAEKFSTGYFDMICLGSRVFQANSYFNAIAAESVSNPLLDVGCPIAFTSTGYIKLVINLKRNNATTGTQNILYVVTFPLKIIADNSLPGYTSNYSCNDSSIIAQASPVEVNNHCNSTALYYTPNRYNRTVPAGLTFNQMVDSDGLMIRPNPTTGAFSIQFRRQQSLLKNITISNISGQKIYELNTNNMNLTTGYTRQINLQLPGGIYLVNCLTSTGLLKTKIVVLTKPGF